MKKVATSLGEMRNETVDSFNELRLKISRYSKNFTKVKKETNMDVQLLKKISAYDDDSVQLVLAKIEEINQQKKANNL